MNKIISAVSRVFAVSVLVIGGVTAAPPEIGSAVAGQPSVEESIASYRKANPAVLRSRGAMTHEPKNHKSRRSLPALVVSGGSNSGPSLPSGKKK
jgi:hypothetical protein